MLYWITILRWKEGTSSAHGTICYTNDTGPLSHRPWRMQILITCYATFQHLLLMAPCSNLLWDSESHFYSFAWLLQSLALSHSKYMVIPQSAQVERFTLLMDFWFDWWTSTGVWFVLIVFYSIWQLLKMESTMSHMLEGFYLDILSMTSFFIKNIYFSSINKDLLVVFKMSGYSEMVSFGAISILLSCTIQVESWCCSHTRVLSFDPIDNWCPSIRSSARAIPGQHQQWSDSSIVPWAATSRFENQRTTSTQTCRTDVHHL